MTQEKEQHGQDWINFKLKVDAPEEVSLGNVRFAGTFRRSDQPFSATRGEWLLFLQATGWFEEIAETES